MLIFVLHYWNCIVLCILRVCIPAMESAAEIAKKFDFKMTYITVW